MPHLWQAVVITPRCKKKKKSLQKLANVFWLESQLQTFTEPKFRKGTHVFLTKGKLFFARLLCVECKKPAMMSGDEMNSLHTRSFSWPRGNYYLCSFRPFVWNAKSWDARDELPSDTLCKESLNSMCSIALLNCQAYWNWDVPIQFCLVWASIGFVLRFWSEIEP